MFVDINGAIRIKICLCRAESDISAGACARLGFDFAAFAEKGEFIPEGEGVLSCAEYKTGNPESTDGEYTLIGLGMTSDPAIPSDWENMIKTSSSKAAEVIKMIHQRNGYAILSCAASHKNTPEELLRLEGLDAIEIAAPERGEHGEAIRLCDALVRKGRPLGILAVGQDLMGGVYVEARDPDAQSVIRAMKAGRFYSSEGDGEIHISQLPSGRVQISCSPSQRIEFFTDSDKENSRCFEGSNLVFAEYVPLEDEKYIRAEITDMSGKRAWTNYIEV